MIGDKKRKHKITAVLFFVLPLILAGVTPALSQGRELTWQDCVETAEKNNPEIVSAREKILQYAAAKKIVVADLLPQVSASATGSRSRSEGGVSGAVTTDSFYYGLSAKQLIFDGFKTVYDVKSADADYEAIRLDYQVTSSGIRYKLRSAWVNYIKARDKLAISTEIQARRKHVYELVKMRYNSGKEHIGSMHSAEADLLMAGADVTAASRDMELANTELCHLLGYDETVKLEISGNLAPAADYGAIPDFGIMAAGLPSVKKAEYSTQSAYYAHQSSMLDYSPKVYGSAGIGRQGESMNSMNNEWSMGFEVTAPLFEGGKTYYTESKKASAYRQAQSDEKSARNTAVSTLRESWNTLKNSIESLAAEKVALTAATERSKIGEMQYTIGTLTFDNWTIIEDNLANTKKAYLNASATAMTAEASWIQSKGGTLENESKN